MSTVSVLIPTVGRGDPLATLRSLPPDTHALVVADGVDLPPLPAHVLRRPRRGGFARAVRTGLRHLRDHGARYVLLLNDDATLHPHALTHLRAAATPDRILVPTVLGPDGPTHGLELNLLGQGREARTHRASPLAGSGAALWLPIHAADWLDPSWDAYYEDLDLCLTARRHGLTVHSVPHALVHHTRSRSYPLARRAYLLARNQPRLLLRHAPTSWLWLLYPLTLLRLLLRPLQDLARLDLPTLAAHLLALPATLALLPHDLHHRSPMTPQTASLLTPYLRWPRD